MVGWFRVCACVCVCVCVCGGGGGGGGSHHFIYQQAKIVKLPNKYAHRFTLCCGLHYCHHSRMREGYISDYEAIARR